VEAIKASSLDDLMAILHLIRQQSWIRRACVGVMALSLLDWFSLWPCARASRL